MYAAGTSSQPEIKRARPKLQVSDVGKAGIGVGMDTPEKRVEPTQVRRLPFDPYTGKPYPPPDEEQQPER